MQKLPFTKDFNNLFIAYCCALGLTIAVAILVFVLAGAAFNGRVNLNLVFPEGITNRVPTLLFFGAFAVVPWIAAIVFFCIMLYRFWELVPAKNRKYEPGYMVGFLFIPLFNLYWIFVSVWGCGKEYNRLFGGTKQNLEIFALIYCIAQCCVWFGIGPSRDWAYFPSEIFCLIWLYQMKNAAIVLQQKKEFEDVQCEIKKAEDSV